MAVSLTVHALLLLGLASGHRPGGSPSPRPEAPGSTVAYLDLPALPATSWPAPAPGGQPAGPHAPERPGAEPAPSGDVQGSPEERASPAPPGDEPALSANAAPAVPEAAGTGLRAGSQDARLYVDPRALRAAAPRSVHERPDGDAGAATRAHVDSAAAAGRRITVGGRRITVPHDSTAHRRGSLHVDLMGRRATMPVDGREWEDLQLRRQQEAFERDSVLRERVRAMRERRTAERAAGRPR